MNDDGNIKTLKRASGSLLFGVWLKKYKRVNTPRSVKGTALLNTFLSSSSGHPGEQNHSFHVMRVTYNKKHNLTSLSSGQNGADDNYIYHHPSAWVGLEYKVMHIIPCMETLYHCLSSIVNTHATLRSKSKENATQTHINGSKGQDCKLLCGLECYRSQSPSSVHGGMSRLRDRGLKRQSKSTTAALTHQIFNDIANEAKPRTNR